MLSSERSELRANVYIGRDVTIGADAMFHSGVRILDRCIVGNCCTIQGGTIVGSDGFGFAPKDDGSYAKIPQTGNVVIEDNCDIGALCTLDRATLGSTIIRNGCKLDNLIQVAHNVVIGEKTVIAAQTGIAGSTTIGSHCLIGGQVGIGGHLKIANGSRIAAKVRCLCELTKSKWHIPRESSDAYQSIPEVPNSSSKACSVRAY